MPTQPKLFREYHQSNSPTGWTGWDWVSTGLNRKQRRKNMSSKKARRRNDQANLPITQRTNPQ